MQHMTIGGLSAALWGRESRGVIVAIHGNFSSKTDVPVQMLARRAGLAGWQVLSVDLPRHGARTDEDTPCKMRICVQEISQVMAFARERWQTVGLFAVSMGAYIGWLACEAQPPAFAWLLSPALDMRRITQEMMRAAGVTPEQLARDGEATAPSGQTFWQDDYAYISAHAVRAWPCPCAVLCGAHDALTPLEDMRAFAAHGGYALTICASAGHWFHTPQELEALGAWMDENIACL